ncbi:hypothetical protein D5086_004540 [Populus alba]|uniref:Uncharacterized protein n=1 Tax=Populus alba TaxID=43335 RepID=A0ACC4CR16_POPAL
MRNQGFTAVLLGMYVQIRVPGKKVKRMLVNHVTPVLAYGFAAGQSRRHLLITPDILWGSHTTLQHPLKELYNTANPKLSSAFATEIDNKAENPFNKYLVTLWQASHKFDSQVKTNDCCHATMFNCWSACNPE